MVTTNSDTNTLVDLGLAILGLVIVFYGIQTVAKMSMEVGMGRLISRTLTGSVARVIGLLYLCAGVVTTLLPLLDWFHAAPIFEALRWNMIGIDALFTLAVQFLGTLIAVFSGPSRRK